MAKSSGGISSGSSGAAYSGGGGLSGMGRASSAAIGGLGGVSGTASSGWGGAQGGMQGYAPTYGGGAIGTVGDSRTFAGLSPRSQAYMQAGSPGSYYNYLHGGAGTGGGDVPQDRQNMITWQDMLASMFSPQQSQQRPDYSQLFANSQVNLESPMMMSQPTEQIGANYKTFSNNPYGA